MTMVLLREIKGCKPICEEAMETKVKSVITKVNASNCLDLSVSIDKTILRLNPYLNEEELIRYFKSKGIDYKVSRLRSEHCISVGKFHFIYLQNTKQIISKLVTNPNDFSSYYEYRKYFDSICSELEVELIPSRLDIAIDIKGRDFNWINRRISIGKKRSLSRYVFEGCNEQTRYFGKAPNELVFYDREEKSKKVSGCRIESRKRGSSQIQSKSLGELESELLDDMFNPFRGVELIDFKLKRVKELNKNLKTILKRERIKTLLSHNGYFYTKKFYNKNRNFMRDFKSFTKEVSKISLEEKYRPLMESYLMSEDCHE
jgi:hypothetical protein